MIIPIQSLTQNLRRDFIYDTLRPPLNLMVDVGAAAGVVTRRLRLAGGPGCRVVAFEPFPGNLPYFESNTSDLDSIRLIQKAVSNQVGTSSFFVSSTVKGNEPGWENHPGYSSVGKLTTNLKERLSLMLTSNEKTRVPTTTLDHEFDEPIAFLKVDVQGAERQVLEGAERLLSKQQVGMAYLEWAGDPGVEDILERHGFAVYDSHYVGWSPDGTSAFEREGFQIVGQQDLSVGQAAFSMINLEDGSADRLRRLNKRRGQWLQTDLIAMPMKRRHEFESLLVASAEERSS